jgi:hypothetical protein
VTGSDEEDQDGATAARELASRLRVPLSRVVVDHGEGPTPTPPRSGNSPFVDLFRGQSNG